MIVAPHGMRDRMIAMIEREAALSTPERPGRIIMKMNNLSDEAVIDALYAASQAGVQIDLIVRSICTLRPGVKELSKNITVRSIVGRFLEHSRIFYFQNGGDEEIYIGSADMMQRNLDRRVEALAAVKSPELKRAAEAGARPGAVGQHLVVDARRRRQVDPRSRARRTRCGSSSPGAADAARRIEDA